MASQGRTPRRVKLLLFLLRARVAKWRRRRRRRFRKPREWRERPELRRFQLPVRGSAAVDSVRVDDSAEIQKLGAAVAGGNGGSGGYGIALEQPGAAVGSGGLVVGAGTAVPEAPAAVEEGGDGDGEGSDCGE